jgi:branched-subunit amino acid aminotransferase/4-amino-4-deoxychorismate lyase
MAVIYYNGEWVSEADAQVSVQSRSVAYGDGCFDTFKVEQGQVLDLRAHLNRLEATLNWLDIELTASRKDWPSLIQQLIQRNQLQNEKVLIRIQAWREGERGYNTTSTRGSLVMVAKKLPEFPAQIRLATVDTRRIPSVALPPQFKLSNGINYIRASREARNAGFDDAVMLTLRNEISETPIANIFWTVGKTLYTPAKTCDLLPGITRQFVLSSIAERLGYSIQEVIVKRSELDKPELVFICNSLREITGVIQWDQWEWSGEQLKKKLQPWLDAFSELKVHKQDSLF